MTTNLLLGVDLGTQSVKAALFGTDGGCRAEAAREVAVRRRSAEEVDQAPEDFYAAAVATISACMSSCGCEPSDVAAVGVAGQMAGILGVGPGGEAVTPYDSWLDSRCRPQLDEIEKTLGTTVTALTGCPPMVAHAPKMLWWRRERPRANAEVAKWVVPSAFVTGRLCELSAEELYIDWTHLHFSGLADAQAGCWSSQLVEGVGIAPSQLPRIVAPTDIVGALAKEAASACGLTAGVPLVAGLGDTAAGVLGAGIVRPGQLLDTAGTASVLAISADSFRPDMTGRLVTMKGALPGQWISLSYLAGGDLLSWLGRSLGPVPLQELVGEAQDAPAGRAIFVPHLGGRILPSAPGARGGWVGINLSHNRGDLVRSVLEAIAFEYAGYLERALELFPELVPSEVRVIGGGSDNKLWDQIKASALGLPYVGLGRENFSCWGAAIVAGSAVGVIPDPAAAALSATAESSRAEPDPELRRLYDLLRPSYEAAVEMLVTPGTFAPQPKEVPW